VEEDYGWAARLYQAWLSWDSGTRWSLLVGIYDLGWHFHSLPSTSVFNRLPGQTTGSFSPGGLGLLDLFPLSAPAVRLQWQPVEGFVIQTAAVWLEAEHGIAAHRLVPELPASQRWLGIAEAVWDRDGTAENSYFDRRFGFGVWALPAARLEDSTRVPMGGYVFADLRVWSRPGQEEQGCAAFGSVSVANHRAGAWEKRAVAGLHWLGLFPRRPADETALAVIVEDSAATSDGAGRCHWNTAAELLHRIPLGEHAYLQSTLLWRQQQADAPDAEQWKIGLTLGISF
jgi:carbohydrate-selective porin OprB